MSKPRADGLAILSSPTTEGTVKPLTDATDDIGMSTKRYRNGYFSGTIQQSNLPANSLVQTDGSSNLVGSNTISQTVNMSSLSPTNLLQTGATKNVVSSNTVTQNLNLSGANNIGSGSQAPSAPSAVITNTGSLGAYNLTGTYSWQCTFLTSAGETTPSAASGSLSTIGSTSMQCTVTLPSPGTSVTGFNIYRTKSGGSTYYLLTTIVGTTTTTYLDNVPDSLLGGTTPSSNTSLNTQTVLGTLQLKQASPSSLLATDSNSNITTVQSVTTGWTKPYLTGPTTGSTTLTNAQSGYLVFLPQGTSAVTINLPSSPTIGTFFEFFSLNTQPYNQTISSSTNNISGFYTDINGVANIHNVTHMILNSARAEPGDKATLTWNGSNWMVESFGSNINGSDWETS